MASMPSGPDVNLFWISLADLAYNDSVVICNSSEAEKNLNTRKLLFEKHLSLLEGICVKCLFCSRLGERMAA